MKVEIHKLFEYLLETTKEAPEAIVGFSLASPPKLEAFLGDPCRLPVLWLAGGAADTEDESRLADAERVAREDLAGADLVAV